MQPGPGKTLGRPRFRPTDEHRLVVARARGFGLTEEQICQLISWHGKAISVDVLQRDFRPELDSGKIQAIYNMAGALYRTGLRGNVSAQIFFLKCIGRWSAPTEILVFDPTKMTQAELDAAIDAVERILPGEFKVIEGDK